MKKIEAIIRPFRIHDLSKELSKMGVNGMTISNVKGFGRQKGHAELQGSTGNKIDFLQKTKLEIVVKDDIVDSVVATIVKFAKTGQVGDGKIFISPMETAIRIRTGESGDSAI